MTAISTGGVAIALEASDSYYDEDVKQTIRKAATSWLKNEDVLSVLETFQTNRDDWPSQASTQPPGGKLFIFNRKVCRSFRNDQHNWRKKNDGRTIKETHEKLKVADQERLNCYYAHADTTDGLQRRCYWILEEAKQDIVLVHYLCCATSRATGGRALTTSAVDLVGSIAQTRPRREAAQRARRFAPSPYEIDDDQLTERGSSRQTISTLASTRGTGSSSDYVPSEGPSGSRELLISASGEPSPTKKIPSLANIPEMDDANGPEDPPPDADDDVAARLEPGALHDSGGLGSPLFTQMSLGSAGDSGNIGLLAGFGLTSQDMANLGKPVTDEQGVDEIMRGDSMRAILKEFQDDPTNYSHMLNELHQSMTIPSASWRKNTGLEASAVEAALAVAAGHVDSIGSGASMRVDHSNPTSGVPSVALTGSSGAMSTKGSIPGHTATNDASNLLGVTPSQQLMPPPPNVDRGDGEFVVGRVKGLLESETLPGHRRTNSGGDEATLTQRRKNPTAAVGRLPADRSAAAVESAAIATHEQRELQLQKARQARQTLASPYELSAELNPPTAAAPVDDDEENDLIEAPNVLFRMTSHLAKPWLAPGGSNSWPSGSGGSGPSSGADQTAGLLKHMSIEEDAAIAHLQAVRDALNGEEAGGATTADVPSASAEEGLGVDASRDPSLSSLLEGMAMPSSGLSVKADGTGGDVLERAMAQHRANAEAKRAASKA